MIQQFQNGATIVTGKDFYQYFTDERNNYDKNCSFCEHEGDERCDNCSLASDDRSCSCHIDPPCSKCVDSAFEPSQHLINYKHYGQNREGKWQWECFKSDKKTWNVFNKMESDGWELSAEILPTGVIAIYLEKPSEDIEEIELCNKKIDFKITTIKFINEVFHKRS